MLLKKQTNDWSAPSSSNPPAKCEIFSWDQSCWSRIKWVISITSSLSRSYRHTAWTGCLRDVEDKRQHNNTFNRYLPWPSPVENKIKILTESIFPQKMASETLRLGYTENKHWKPEIFLSMLGKGVCFVCLLKTNCLKMKRNGRLKPSRQSQKLENCALFWRQKEWCEVHNFPTVESTNTLFFYKNGYLPLVVLPLIAMLMFLKPFSVDFYQKASKKSMMCFPNHVACCC